VRVAHRGRRFRQRTQTRTKASIGRRLLVGPSRVCHADRASRTALHVCSFAPAALS